MKIWLDDERPMPSGFTQHCRTAHEAIALLKTGGVELISLDHDLGEHAGTGYDVAVYIERAAHEGNLEFVRVRFHSMNPVGKEKMKQAIRSAHRAWGMGKVPVVEYVPGPRPTEVHDAPCRDCPSCRPLDPESIDRLTNLPDEELRQDIFPCGWRPEKLCRGYFNLVAQELRKRAN